MRESELDEALAAAQDARDAQQRQDSTQALLLADARKAGGELAATTAKLSVQLALCESKDVEIEELKAALERRVLEGEAAGEALAGTADGAKQLRAEVSRLQGCLKVQVRRRSVR